MLMQNMDEAADIKPRVTIEGKQLELLKIDTATIGQKFEMKATAVIASVNQYKGEDGVANNSITFELVRVELAAPEADLSSFYPNSKGGQ